MKRCRLKRYNFKIRNKMSKENKPLRTTKHGNDFIADANTRYSYLEIEERLKSQIDYMIQCVQDSQGTIDPSEDINEIEITLKVLKHVYNV